MSDKTSDKNVDSIEKDIERCKQLTKPEHASWIGISNQLAITDILAELERRNKRIKELEEELAEFNKQLDLDYVDENFISKQVVIDTMEELNNEIKNGDTIEAIFKIKQQQILQELLERGNK